MGGGGGGAVVVGQNFSHHVPRHVVQVQVVPIHIRTKFVHDVVHDEARPVRTPVQPVDDASVAVAVEWEDPLLPFICQQLSLSSCKPPPRRRPGGRPPRPGLWRPRGARPASGVGDCRRCCWSPKRSRPSRSKTCRCVVVSQRRTVASWPVVAASWCLLCIVVVVVGMAGTRRPSRRHRCAW